MNCSESSRHRELKRLALVWAQAHGWRVAAAEVSLPNMRYRLDVAAYRPERRGRNAAVGMTAVFECKVTREDYLRDARTAAATMERLRVLHERKGRIEQELRLHYPSILNGDSLFPEYQGVDFERPGHERYQRTLRDIRMLDGRLRANTKFECLVRWGAANLFWLVAPSGLVAPQEAPAGWGVLVAEGQSLRVAALPILQQVAEAERLALLHRIAMAAGRAVNREHGIEFEELRREA